jgi:hypothetical protein
LDFAVEGAPPLPEEYTGNYWPVKVCNENKEKLWPWGEYRTFNTITPLTIPGVSGSTCLAGDAVRVHKDDLLEAWTAACPDLDGNQSF